MWFARLKLAVTLTLAAGVFTAVVTLAHDWPNNYDVSVGVRRATAYLRVTPRHVVIGGWGSDPSGAQGIQPIWRWGPLAVCSVPRDATTERADAVRESAVRVGEFGVLRGVDPRYVQARCVAVMLPTWLACAVGLVPLALVVRGHRRRRRWGEHGQCASCGYDLRATPGRCPECGTEPQVSQTTSGVAASAATGGR